MKYSFLIASLAAFALLSLIAPGNAQAQLQYSLTDLGTFGGAQSRAFGINNSGQVVGWAHTGGGIQHAYIWTPGGIDGYIDNPQMKDIGTLGGSQSRAWAINNLGHVVGESNTASGDRGFLYDGLTLTNLGTLGGNWSYANDINDAGRITGGSSNTTGINSDTYAFIWTPGGTGGPAANPQMKSIPFINTGGGKHNAYGFGINNANTIVGYGDKSSTSDHAFRYNGTSVTDISPVGANYHYAWDINDSGWVAGEGNNAANSFYQAYRYDGANYLFLGTLGGTTSEAYAINNNGEVVGRSQTGGTLRNAFIHTAGQMLNLNNMIPAELGWTLTEARDINAAGQIVGFGLDSLGQTRSFLLTPNRVPGDTDYDGDVDLADLGNLASSYGTTLGAGWTHGNFDGDGDVDLADLGTLATNYGAGASQAFADFRSIVSVPETSTLGLAAAAIAALCGRRKR